MIGKRIFVILGFGILVAGTLTALWLMTLPARHQTSSHFVEQRAEKERQRLELIQQVALKQQRLEERQLADAQRLAEQDRQRHNLEDRRLADAVRALETERLRQAEIVQASVIHREKEELRAAEVRQLAARQRQLEEDRHENERVYQAEVVQASMKQHLDADRRQVEAAMVPANAKGADARVMEVAAKPAGLKVAKYRTASGSKVGRPRKCAKSCDAASRRGRNTDPWHSRRHAPAAGESRAYLCPWRWFESVIAELIGPARIAERSNARRYS